MKNKLYMINDRVAGYFSKPFSAVNDNMAIRTFKQFVKSQDDLVRGDLELYCVGEYDDGNGKFELSTSAQGLSEVYPLFICRGEVSEVK